MAAASSFRPNSDCGQVVHLIPKSVVDEGQGIFFSIPKSDADKILGSLELSRPSKAVLAALELPEGHELFYSAAGQAALRRLLVRRKIEFDENLWGIPIFSSRLRP